MEYSVRVKDNKLQGLKDYSIKIRFHGDTI